MATIKWSTGETYHQSYRKNKRQHAEQQHAEQQHAEQQHAEQQHAEQQHAEQHAEQQAEQQAEQHKEGNVHGIGRNFVFKDSYKEEVLHRIGEREQMQQCCVNPFVGDNFIKDLAVQEEYLKPRNSHYSK